MQTRKTSAARVRKKKVVYGGEYQLFLRALRAAREEAGLTQEQVAERLQVGQTVVSRSERGEHRVDIAELFYFCEAYGVSFADFTARLEAGFRAQQAVPEAQDE